MNLPDEALIDPPGRRRELVFRRPDSLLREHVTRYCGYFELDLGPTRRLEVPSVSVGLIMGLGPPVEIVYPRLRGGSAVQATSFIAGLHDTPAVAASVGWQHGLQVDVTPIGARMLFGLPMHELTNRAVALDEIWGGTARRLVEQVQEASTWAARFNLIDALLIRRLNEAQDVSAEIRWAWTRLGNTNGRLKIGTLADELGTSREQLVAKFRSEIGLPPKTIGRILRFQRAVLLLQQSADHNFSRIAQDCGFYDQPHFNRDFFDLAGTTPTKYLAHQLPDGAGVLS